MFHGGERKVLIMAARVCVLVFESGWYGTWRISVNRALAGLGACCLFCCFACVCVWLLPTNQPTLLPLSLWLFLLIEILTQFLDPIPDQIRPITLGTIIIITWQTMKIGWRLCFIFPFLIFSSEWMFVCVCWKNLKIIPLIMPHQTAMSTTISNTTKCACVCLGHTHTPRGHRNV